MRDMEREIIPMCEDQGMAIAPWGSLGRGNFRPAEQYKVVKEGGRHMGEPTENDIKVAAVLEDIAKSRGSNITGVVSSVVHRSGENRRAILICTTGNGIRDAQDSECLPYPWRS